MRLVRRDLPSFLSKMATYSRMPHRVELAATFESRHRISFITNAGAAAPATYTIILTDPENVLTTPYIRHLIATNVGQADITPHLVIKRSLSFTEHPGPADWYIHVPDSLFAPGETIEDFCLELKACLP